MRGMFEVASAFDQDLGWCVANDVSLNNAYDYTPCASTSCGVKQVAGGCAPTPAPGALGSDGATARPVALGLAIAVLLV